MSAGTDIGAVHEASLRVLQRTGVLVPDAQAAAESSQGAAAAFAAGADFLFQAAGGLSSLNVLSLEKLVLDDAMLETLRGRRSRSGPRRTTSPRT